MKILIVIFLGLVALADLPAVAASVSLAADDGEPGRAASDVSFPGPAALRGSVELDEGTKQAVAELVKESKRGCMKWCKRSGIKPDECDKKCEAETRGEWNSIAGCKPAGASCVSDFECCGVYCHLPGGNMLMGTCVGPPPTPRPTAPPTPQSCTRDADCKEGNPKSRVCIRGWCRLCLPLFGANCYCASNDGRDPSDYDIHFVWPRHRDPRVENINLFPIGGGQYMRKCRECGQNLVKDGILTTLPKCFLHRWGASGVYLETKTVITDYEGMGFFPKDTDIARREPEGCGPSFGGDCRLYCGDYRGHHMDVKIVFREASIPVMGLPFGVDWKHACDICGENLEVSGFIKSGWNCEFNFPFGMLLGYELRFN